MVQHCLIFSYAGAQDHKDASRKSHTSSELRSHDDRFLHAGVVLETMEIPGNLLPLLETFAQLTGIAGSILWLGWKHWKSTR